MRAFLLGRGLVLTASPRRPFRLRGIRRSLGEAAIAVGLLLTCSPSSAQAAGIFWGNVVSGTIGRANLDGTGVDQSFIPVSNPGRIGLAVDDDFIYWTNYNLGTIGRANVDGTGVNPNFIVAGITPAYVAVDDSFIYWTDASADTIGRANLDGTGVDQSFITGADDPSGIAVDEAFIYWVNPAGMPRIGRANLDGTGVNQSFISHPPAWDLEVYGSFLYWTSRQAESVGRATLDGSSSNTQFIFPAWEPFGVSEPLGVAVHETSIYWTNSAAGTIGRANRDGTGVDRSFITGASYPSSVAVSLVPICDNTLDDDGDGLGDYPDDPGCTDLADGSERGTAVCDNGLDDDGDGIADFPEDPGCTDIEDGSEHGTALCDNGLDDDGDGLVDHPLDRGCSSLVDEDELSSVQCDNGLDDDFDGLIDWRGDDTGDPECWGINDPSELPSPPPGCGLGPELAFLLAPLWWLRRRTKRSGWNPPDSPASRFRVNECEKRSERP